MAARAKLSSKGPLTYFTKGVLLEQKKYKTINDEALVNWLKGVPNVIVEDLEEEKKPAKQKATSL